MLSDEYIAEARQRAYRFQGQWCGTSGSLAADTARMIMERKELMGTIAQLEQDNATMRAAIESHSDCCDGGKCHSPPPIDLPDGYKAYTLTPAVPVQEATFEDPIPVAAMAPEQLDAAWAGIKERQRELHERIRDPYATDPLDRRVVGDVSAIHAAKAPADSGPSAIRTLHDAIAAVTDRHGRYGPPAEHFARTAGMVNAAFGTSFTAADWALVMVLDKVARQRGPAATDDAAIDIAGYAACHQECRCTKVQ